MEKIRYSIIGCGNVAGDYKNKQKIGGIYTQADAFSRIKAFKPIACFDLYIKEKLNNKLLSYEKDKLLTFEEIYQLSKKAYKKFLDKNLINKDFF